MVHNIYIANRKRKKEGLTEEFGDAFYLDVTYSSSDELLRTLSPMFPHGNVPVPFSNRKLVAKSLEGIWQGLKVFSKEGADFSWFNKYGDSKIKRVESPRGRGQILGHQRGIYVNEPLLTLIEARSYIYGPVYKWILNNNCQQAIDYIRKCLEQKDVVFLEAGNQSNIRDIYTPLVHSELLRLFIQNQYPKCGLGNCWVPYTLEEHQKDIYNRKVNKIERINMQKKKRIENKICFRLNEYGY